MYYANYKRKDPEIARSLIKSMAQRFKKIEKKMAFIHHIKRFSLKYKKICGFLEVRA